MVATAGSQAKCETARARGRPRHRLPQVDDLAAAVRAFTPDGRGVDVAYDGVGASTFDASLASLRPRGTLAIFGGGVGAVPPVDVQRLNAGGSLFLTRPSLAHHVADRGELLARAGECWAPSRTAR